MAPFLGAFRDPLNRNAPPIDLRYTGEKICCALATAERSKPCGEPENSSSRTSSRAARIKWACKVAAG
jgi:hypothetical protein